MYCPTMFAGLNIYFVFVMAYFNITINTNTLVFNKNPSGANSVKIILGLSVQGGNKYGSTLVLSNKNHVEVIIIFILHQFCSTKPE